MNSYPLLHALILSTFKGTRKKMKIKLEDFYTSTRSTIGDKSFVFNTMFVYNEVEQSS